MGENTKVEATLAEYEALRDEILQRQKIVNELLTYSIISTGALLGYGFTVQQGYIFLVSFAILIPLSYAVKKESDTILVIATYIYAVIERRELGFSWETFRYRLRKVESQKKQRMPRLIECIMIYDLLSISTLILAFIYWKSELSYLAIIAVLVFAYFAWWNLEASKSYSYQKQTKLIADIEKITEKLTSPAETKPNT